MKESMSSAELRAGVSLAGVFGLRMLGLFLILPVFAVHAPQLAGGDNLLLVGVALGAYGLSQAILHIPFGMASDRWGRKPVIYAGLVIFAAGSFLAAAAGDIWTVIAGRTLQGAGAISSAVVALAADLTREQHRTKTMALIGASIGCVFALSLVAAPALYRWIGMGGLFSLTGLLSLCAIWVVKRMVPDAPLRVHAAPEGGAAMLREALLQPDLLRLNLGIFVLHLVQMAMFVVVPRMLVDAGLALHDHWMLYLPAVLLSFALMLPPVLYADRRNRAKPVLAGFAPRAGALARHRHRRVQHDADAGAFLRRPAGRRGGEKFRQRRTVRRLRRTMRSVARGRGRHACTAAPRSTSLRVSRLALQGRQTGDGGDLIWHRSTR